MTHRLDTKHVRSIKLQVESSIIDYLEYSHERFQLIVSFKHGKYKGQVRSYYEIAPEQFYALLEAPSLGKALLRFIDTLKSVKDYS